MPGQEKKKKKKKPSSIRSAAGLFGFFTPSNAHLRAIDPFRDDALAPLKSKECVYSRTAQILSNI